MLLWNAKGNHKKPPTKPTNHFITWWTKSKGQNSYEKEDQKQSSRSQEKASFRDHHNKQKYLISLTQYKSLCVHPGQVFSMGFAISFKKGKFGFPGGEILLCRCQLSYSLGVEHYWMKASSHETMLFPQDIISCTTDLQTLLSTQQLN